MKASVRASALILCLALCLVSFSACEPSRPRPMWSSVTIPFDWEAKLSIIVLSNKETLDEWAQKVLEAGRASGERKKVFELKLDGKTRRIVYENPENRTKDPRYNEHVVFHIGAFANTYFDLYYSPENVPFEEIGHTRVSDSPDSASDTKYGYGWAWGGKTHYGFTYRICENWFYSESTYS